MVRKVLKLAWWLLLAPGTYLLYQLAFLCPQVVEQVYSRAIYPVITYIMGTLTNLFSFSLAEILLYVFALVIVFFIIFILSALFRPKGKKLYHLFRRLIALGIVICSLYTSFILGWGLNYARQPLSDSLGLTIEEATASELESVCTKLAQKTSDLRGQVLEDAQGVFMTRHAPETILKMVPDLYDEYAPGFLNLGAKVQVKGVMTPGLLSSLLTSGVYCPFTCEPNINLDMPALSIPSTAAHEYAHLKGFAREDEANFIAWYVLHDADDVDFAYSANVVALTYAMNALAEVDMDAYRRIYQELHPGIIRDWVNEDTYWEPFRTDFATQAQEVYNDYLISNRVEDGRKSYGRMLDLMIALDRAGQLT